MIFQQLQEWLFIMGEDDIILLYPVPQRVAADAEHPGGFDLVVSTFLKRPGYEHFLYQLDDVSMSLLIR